VGRHAKLSIATNSPALDVFVSRSMVGDNYPGRSTTTILAG
jgi:hypothetical protein